MLFVVLFTALAVLFPFVVHFLWSYYRLCKLVRSLPGWPTHWLYGNLHQKREKKLTFMDDYCKWAHEGRHPISKEWLGPFIVQININHPDLVKEVLNAPKAHWVYHNVQLWLGEGLLLSEGKRWARNSTLR